MSKKFATLAETRKNSIENLERLAQFITPLVTSIKENTTRIQAATTQIAELVIQHRAETQRQAELLERNSVLLEKLTELSAKKGGK
jgi:hypothetical protein